MIDTRIYVHTVFTVNISTVRWTSIDGSLINLYSPEEAGIDMNETDWKTRLV